MSPPVMLAAVIVAAAWAVPVTWAWPRVAARIERRYEHRHA